MYRGLQQQQQQQQRTADELDVILQAVKFSVAFGILNSSLHHLDPYNPSPAAAAAAAVCCLLDCYCSTECDCPCPAADIKQRTGWRQRQQQLQHRLIHCLTCPGIRLHANSSKHSNTRTAAANLTSAAAASHTPAMLQQRDWQDPSTAWLVVLLLLLLLPLLLQVCIHRKIPGRRKRDRAGSEDQTTSAPTHHPRRSACNSTMAPPHACACSSSKGKR